MTKEKFIYDTETVLKFIQFYCEKEHIHDKKNDETVRLYYRDEDLEKEISFNLCEDCEKTFFYSFIKLQECSFEEKPSCRKCPEPCYGKYEWKKVAKIMKYSGMKLGFLKIKKLFKRAS